MAIWTMIPDKIEEEETQVAKKFGVFGATLITRWQFLTASYTIPPYTIVSNRA